jgi:MoaA/NifB/PqqE/SkfB family radical SAM enzyme
MAAGERQAANPTTAVVAVTGRCNSRCVMCDIWQRPPGVEMPPGAFQRLPPSLRVVNLTGGEPFLRQDLPEVVAAIRRASPRVRLILSTNGLVLGRIRRMAPRLVTLDPSLAVRVSLDGLGALHDQLRGVPGAFDRARQALDLLREAGVSDLGISMTLMRHNVPQVGQVYGLAEELGIDFSLTFVSESPLFYGEGKSHLRPADPAALVKAVAPVIQAEYRHGHPKRWLRAWFTQHLVDFAVAAPAGRRALPCDAGEGFFYLDPGGDVYGCHLLPGRLGSLVDEEWEALWRGAAAQVVRQQATQCNGCWMVCTARTEMRKRLWRVGREALAGKIAAHLPGGGRR